MSRLASIPGGRKRLAQPMLYLILALVGVLYALPLLWILISAAKPGTVAAGGDATGPIPPISRLIHNSGAVLNSPTADFPLYIHNSLYVALLSMVGMVASSAVVAYGFSRIQWRGRNSLFVVVLATMMIPFTVLMAPQYLLFKHLGWIGSFRPLWAPAFFGGAFSIFLLRQFFMGIPRELDEASRLDGCSHWGTFRWVILPLARPALAVVAMLQFIASWNDFVGPLVFINHESRYTAALGLQMYQTQHGGTPWNLVMAASLIVILPVFVVFLVAQRALIEGVATQGLKE